MSQHRGIPMTEDEFQDWQQSFIDIKESIELVMKNGVEL